MTDSASHDEIVGNEDRVAAAAPHFLVLPDDSPLCDVTEDPANLFRGIAVDVERGHSLRRRFDPNAVVGGETLVGRRLPRLPQIARRIEDLPPGELVRRSASLGADFILHAAHSVHL